MNQRVRTPVAAVSAEGIGTVVICDDGSAFTLFQNWPWEPVEWRPLTPIPGTIEAQIQAEREAEPVGCGDPRD